MKVVLGLLIIAAASLAAQAQAQGQGSKAITELVASTDKIVKGSPFSAEGVLESLQVLTDGNRITRTSSNKMYRDAQGRFRRDGIVNPGATLGVDFNLQPVIIILDPVDGFKYYVNSDSRTVRKLTFRLQSAIRSTVGGTLTYEPGHVLSAAEYAEAAKKLGTGTNTDPPGTYTRVTEVVAPRSSGGQATASTASTGQIAVVGGVSGTVGVHGGGSYNTSIKTEELGVQTIGGVQAEGKRTITTIPAGAIGNERPIDITYERWYSKDLDMIVSSRHSDPRFGDQIFKLTNISRSEPDSSLFAVPADFKVVFDQGFEMAIPRRAPAAPTPKPSSPTMKPAPPAPAPKIII